MQAILLSCWVFFSLHNCPVFSGGWNSYGDITLFTVYVDIEGKKPFCHIPTSSQLQHYTEKTNCHSIFPSLVKSPSRCCLYIARPWAPTDIEGRVLSPDLPSTWSSTSLFLTKLKLKKPKSIQPGGVLGLVWFGFSQTSLHIWGFWVVEWKSRINVYGSPYWQAWGFFISLAPGKVFFFLSSLMLLLSYVPSLLLTVTVPPA